jgi:hypothetical protein
VQTEAPAPEYVPAPQPPQSTALVFSSNPENLPAVQSVQTEAPAAAYVPASQLMHSVCPVANWYWPGWHALHVDDAVTLLYVPAQHAVHCAAVRFSLKNPGAHGTQ